MEPLVIELPDDVLPFLSDERCFSFVVKELYKNNRDKVVLVKEGDFYYIDDESLKLLKEYVNFVRSLKIKKVEKPLEVLEFLKRRRIKKRCKLLELIEKGKTLEEIFLTSFRPNFILAFISENVRGKIIKKYKIDGCNIFITLEKGKLNYSYYILPRELNLSPLESLRISKCVEKIKFEHYDNPEFLINKEKGVNFIMETFNLPKNLAEICYRYSFGFGIIDLLIKDEKIQDIYIDSPGNRDIYIYHEDFGLCDTNICLSIKEVERLASKFRLLSGRPFDEAFPVIDLEIGNVRICSITEPLTFFGKGIAIRKHKQYPFTLSYFVKEGYINKDIAGLLSFLVDNDVSLLISGVRGSGKTSLLSSLLVELKPSRRIIVIEDTKELPVSLLREFNYKIEHLKVSPPFFKTHELRPRDALIASLRLGESVLVIGEVRGEEASYLFEAMRIGATGSAVLGTIHGSSPIDVFDRIVNDLKIPSSSFKAVNLLLITSLLQKKKSLVRERKLTYIGEILKNWSRDPFKEKGILDIATFSKGKLIIKNLRKSRLLREIAKRKNCSLAEILKEIKLRSYLKGLLSNFSSLSKEGFALEVYSNVLFSRTLVDKGKIAKKDIKEIAKKARILSRKFAKEE